MDINSSPAFKSYVPVSYFAKNPKTGFYVPVLKCENIKKCQRFVVQNLNGTAKNNTNSEFVDMYKKYDRDYVLNPVVRSVYDDKNPIVHMVTGPDVEVVNKLAKPIGKAKGDAIDRTGKSKSYETRIASRSFFSEVKAYFSNSSKRLKSENGKNLKLAVFFNPQYGKKNDLKGFEFVSARMVEEN